MSKHALRLLATASLAALLSACAAAVIGGVAGGGYYAAKGDRSVDTRADDAAITSTINTLYVKDDKVGAMDINVETRSGTVTLHGRVPSQSSHRRAVDLAGSVRGVKRVVSKLAVVP